MSLPKIIQDKNDLVVDLCHKFRVKRLYVFGSILTSNFHPDHSDLDFYIEMDILPPIQRGEYLIKIWDSLEQIFARKVDLVTDQPIKNEYLRRNINQTKKLIYDGKGEEIFG